MTKINIKIEKRYIRKDGRSALRISVYHNNKTMYIRTNIYVSAKDWNADKQVIMGAQNRTLNTLLQKQRNDIETRFVMLQSNGAIRTLSDKQFLKALSGESAEDSPHYFSNIMQSFVNAKTNQRTKQIYQATIAKMRLFCDYDSITFEEMNVSWLRAFDAWMTESGNSTNSRSIHLRNIRTIFNAAIDDELITCYPFRRFKIQSQETEKRSISINDIRKLLTCNVQPFQEKYRDCFFLIFYLIGINTIDLSRLTSIENGRIKYKRAKTGKLYNIKVEPEALAIIERYRGKTHLLKWFDNRKDYRTFGMRLDENLQRIAQEHNLPSLTSYVARHSWATYASELDISRDIISHALGHHVNVTDTYIRFNYEKVDEANRRVIDYLHAK